MVRVWSIPNFPQGLPQRVHVLHPIGQPGSSPAWAGREDACRAAACDFERRAISRASLLAPKDDDIGSATAFHGVDECGCGDCRAEDMNRMPLFRKHGPQRFQGERVELTGGGRPQDRNCPSIPRCTPPGACMR